MIQFDHNLDISGHMVAILEPYIQNGRQDKGNVSNGC